MYFHSQGNDLVVWLGYFGVEDSSQRCVKLMDLPFHLIWIDHEGWFQKLQHVLLFPHGF